jgi:methylmalonyl-CoA/ethylmalonyl-CoA epimerase
MNTVAKLEHIQICYAVPDIHATVKFFSTSLGIEFPKPELSRQQDLNMKYHGQIVNAEWLTTQTYNGIYIELVQPLSGQSMFHDYLSKYPDGGIQHHAFRLPVDGFERVIDNLRQQGYEMISEVDHPIARMAYFDTYKTMGAVTEIMGITAEGWKVLEQMEKSN